MMLQSGDRPERREWMAQLARAPLEMLEGWMRQLVEAGNAPARTWLRRPETGLVMLRGRIGGAGDPFNFGEMTVTRCTLRLESGEVGVAYVGGRSQRKAEAAALADALLQSPAWRTLVERGLLEPLRQHLASSEARSRGKAQATRVEFFTVAREAGA